MVGELHSLLHERLREMQTKAFTKEMCLRSGIDGTHSELVRGYGLRQARYLEPVPKLPLLLLGTGRC